jgi:hypothetical protein
MTAPARTGTPRHGKAAAPRHRRETATPGGRSPAVARAYARRAQRTGGRHGGRDSVGTRTTPFVVLLMVLLAMVLVATLWLSTAATADSYHLQGARKVARNLTERSESLGREVATLETAPEVARRARELGMVPAGDPARLVVHQDGTVTLIGRPHRAIAPAPPPPAAVPVPLPPAAVPAPPVPAAPPALPPPPPSGRI